MPVWEEEEELFRPPRDGWKLKVPAEFGNGTDEVSQIGLVVPNEPGGAGLAVVGGGGGGGVSAKGYKQLGLSGRGGEPRRRRGTRGARVSCFFGGIAQGGDGFDPEKWVDLGVCNVVATQ